MTGDTERPRPLEAPEGARDVEAWQQILQQALADRAPQPLQLAEQALRAFPGDFILLYLAALAALLDARPDRCLTYVKRMGKRFITDEREELLRALALGQQRRFVLAAEILKRHGLDDLRAAAACFLGDRSLLLWLVESLEAIHTGSRPQPPAKVAPAKGATKAGQSANAFVSPAGMPGRAAAGSNCRRHGFAPGRGRRSATRQLEMVATLQQNPPNRRGLTAQSPASKAHLPPRKRMGSLLRRHQHNRPHRYAVWPRRKSRFLEVSKCVLLVCIMQMRYVASDNIRLSFLIRYLYGCYWVISKG